MPKELRYKVKTNELSYMQTKEEKKKKNPAISPFFFSK
jgi:hypothetical protein